MSPATPEPAGDPPCVSKANSVEAMAVEQSSNTAPDSLGDSSSHTTKVPDHNHARGPSCMQDYLVRASLRAFAAAAGSSAL